MEEKKKVTKPSYEELEKKASEVFMANQKMQQHIEKMQNYIQQLQGALDDKEFNESSFFLSMLFKVMDHPDSYKKEFVEWCVENIQSSLIAFVNTVADGVKKENEEKEAADEAE